MRHGLFDDFGVFGLGGVERRVGRAENSLLLADLEEFLFLFVEVVRWGGSESVDVSVKGGSFGLAPDVKLFLFLFNWSVLDDFKFAYFIRRKILSWAR